MRTRCIHLSRAHPSVPTTCVLVKFERYYCNEGVGFLSRFLLYDLYMPIVDTYNKMACAFIAHFQWKPFNRIEFYKYYIYGANKIETF